LQVQVIDLNRDTSPGIIVFRHFTWWNHFTVLHMVFLVLYVAL